MATTIVDSKLEASGRITEVTKEPGYQWDIIKYNGASKKIDGARLMAFNPSSNTVTIRLDHSTCPSFWAEVHIPLDKLSKWVENEKVDMFTKNPMSCGDSVCAGDH